jgi:hypothetical protein
MLVLVLVLLVILMLRLPAVVPVAGPASIHCETCT